MEASIAVGPLAQASVENVTISLDTHARTVISVTLALDVNLVMAPAIGDLDEITLRRTEQAVILGS